MVHLSVKKDKTENQVAKADKKPNALTRFGKGIMPTLSKLSKAFLLPIALLPIAGVFLGVGAAIANAGADQSGLWYFGTVLNKMGDVCFGNLPILFCMSVAMAYSKDAGVAALTAVVGFLVMNGMQAALLGEVSHVDIADPANPIKVIDSYTILWHTGVPTGLITSNVGVTSLNTGVFAGIFVGAIAAQVYNRFHKTQLPQMIAFFSGTKLVPIITFFAVIPLSFIFIIFWPWIGKGLAWFGTESGKLPGGLDSFIYEVVERSLVPFGLHHVFYSPLWWTQAGGSVSDVLTNASAAYNSNELFNGIDLHNWTSSNGQHFEEFYNAVKASSLWGANGDQTIMAKVLANLNIANFADMDDMGLNLGRFQSGKFGFMLLGLPMAALAMWLTVPKENRKQVMGIYFSAAFTCFLTGITEPLEYTFLFLAPWLFYGVHMPLAAIAFLLTGMLHTHVSMTVSGGMIDYIVFGIIPFFSGAFKGGNGDTNWLSAFGVLFVALGSAPIYFAAFFFAVKYGKVMVPGRDVSAGDASDVKLLTKDDYKAKHGQNRDGSPLTVESSLTKSANPAEIARYKKAESIIDFLGGESNIVDVDACASRLRLTVIDGEKVNKEGIISLGGATGALVRGTNVQVVYGGEQEAIKPRMLEILEQQRKNGEASKVAIGASTESSTPIVKVFANDQPMLVDADMMAECPKCGEKFKIELLNAHEDIKPIVKKEKVKPVAVASVAKATSVKKPVAKKTVAKPATVKPMVKKEVVAKTVAKPVTKKTPSKETESTEYLKAMEVKYAKQLADQKAKEAAADKARKAELAKAKTEADKKVLEAKHAKEAAKKAKLTSEARAKVDGSDSITEERSELQKHANQLRSVAQDKKVNAKNVNLRDMTKKELITYMQSISQKINAKNS